MFFKKQQLNLFHLWRLFCSSTGVVLIIFYLFWSHVASKNQSLMVLKFAKCPSVGLIYLTKDLILWAINKKSSNGGEKHSSFSHLCHRHLIIFNLAFIPIYKKKEKKKTISLFWLWWKEFSSLGSRYIITLMIVPINQTAVYTA